MNCNEMTIDRLKTGMIVIHRNGVKGLVLCGADEGDKILSLANGRHCMLHEFDQKFNNMVRGAEYDIMKVQRYHNLSYMLLCEFRSSIPDSSSLMVEAPRTIWTRNTNVSEEEQKVLILIDVLKVKLNEAYEELKQLRVRR